MSKFNYPFEDDSLLAQLIPEGLKDLMYEVADELEPKAINVRALNKKA